MAMKKAKKNKARNTLPLMLLAFPGLLYMVINNYIPMFGIFIAFKEMDYRKGIFGSDWVGFKNFRFLFKTNDAFVMTRNTLLYNTAFIVLGVACSVFIAILMSEVTNMAIAKFFQAGLILPNLISMVIVSYIVYAFLNADTGFINLTVLRQLGLPEINWYSEAAYWPFILTIVQLWKTAGYGSVVYIAFIAGIDKGIYESARIDGAGKLKQITDITLPMLKPVIIVMVLIAIGRIFNSDFGLFYQVPMNSGPLYSTTQTIDTYVYRALMQINDIGMSSAAGLYQSVVGFVLVLAANAVVKKYNSEYALF
ncbi:MAG: ABC transporter permease [Bacillota bacterium]